MTAPRGWHRGHPIFYRDGAWVYADGTSADVQRPCVRCGRMPNPDGSDACLGHLPGIASACCGHGVTEPICIPVREEEA